MSPRQKPARAKRGVAPARSACPLPLHRRLSREWQSLAGISTPEKWPEKTRAVMLLLPAQKFLKRLLDSVRRNSKLTKSGHLGRWHIVDLHQLHLIPSDRRTWHHLRNPSQCVPSGEWNRNEEALQPGLACDRSEKLLVSIDPGADALECDGVCFRP